MQLQRVHDVVSNNKVPREVPRGSLMVFMVLFTKNSLSMKQVFFTVHLKQQCVNYLSFDFPCVELVVTYILIMQIST